MDDLGPGELINIVRKRKEIQATELASRVGISRHYMSSIMTERRPLNEELAIKIGQVLDLDPLDLMTRKAKREIARITGTLA